MYIVRARVCGCHLEPYPGARFDIDTPPGACFSLGAESVCVSWELYTQVANIYIFLSCLTRSLSVRGLRHDQSLHFHPPPRFHTAAEQSISDVQSSC